MNRTLLLALSLWIWASVGGSPAQDRTPIGGGISPDHRFTILQTNKVSPDGGYVFTYQVVDVATGKSSILNASDPPEDAAYSAGFSFTADSKWLVRMQKIASGESTLFLYHRQGGTFLPATPKKLGDLAWDFFFSQTEAQGIAKNNLSKETILVRGLKDNYKSLGESWPNSRYAVISLSSGESGTTPIGPWRCVYDLEKGAFSIPPDMAAFNKKHMPWK